jgi:hypothetical protein
VTSVRSVQLPAPLAVTVEIRAADVGARVDRVFRLAERIGVDGLRLIRPLPFDAGRSVIANFALPGDAVPLTAAGRVVAVAPADEERSGERAQPRAIAFTSVPPDDQARVQAYVDERLRA